VRSVPSVTLLIGAAGDLLGVLGSYAFEVLLMRSQLISDQSNVNSFTMLSPSEQIALRPNTASR
jgi:hypothetical protein